MRQGSAMNNPGGCNKQNTLRKNLKKNKRVTSVHSSAMYFACYNLKTIWLVDVVAPVGRSKAVPGRPPRPGAATSTRR